MTHERTKKDLLYSMIFFSIALVFFYIAYIIVPRIDIACDPGIRARIPQDAIIETTYFSKRRGSPVGELVLAKDLIVLGPNGNIILLKSGVVLGIAIAVVKVMPLLIFMSFLTGYTGLWLVYKSLTGRDLWFPRLRTLSISFVASLAALLIPSWPDIGPGSEAYLRIEEFTYSNGITIVHDGLLASSYRIIAAQALSVIIIMTLVCIGILFIGIGFVFAYMRSR